jgi:hypothetical protein
MFGFVLYGIHFNIIFVYGNHFNIIIVEQDSY